MIGPQCESCGGADTELRTSTSANTIGRQFWRCTNFTSKDCLFEWFDPLKSYATSTGRNCKCGLPSTESVVRSNRNNCLGLHYYKCAASGNSCDFFYWKNPTAAGIRKAEADRVRGETSPVTCSKCKASVTVKIVQSSAKGNRGRPFYKCGGCGNFEFTDGCS